MTAPDIPTGAMVALVPTAEHAARLAIEGGEAAGELHLTLCYLGDAVDIGDDAWAELTDAMRALAGQWQTVDAEAFAVAEFNPLGDEPCTVLLCSGADLAEFYETVLADVTEVMPLPEDTHAPWIPHVTLAYFGQMVDGHLIAADGATSIYLGDAFALTGPIVFDRIRLARAGEVTDLPLVAYAGLQPGGVVEGASGVEDAPTADVVVPTQEPAMTAAGALDSREPWDGPLSDHWR